MTTLNWEKMSMVKATKTLWGQGGALASLRGLLGGRDELVIDVAKLEGRFFKPEAKLRRDSQGEIITSAGLAARASKVRFRVRVSAR